MCFLNILTVLEEIVFWKSIPVIYHSITEYMNSNFDYSIFCVFSKL